MAKANVQQKVNFHLHTGALHNALGVKPGKKLTLAQENAALARAKRSGNVKLEREAQFAINARSFNH